MERALSLMTSAIAEILHRSEPSIYLYGSAAMDDFHPGWSDIDLLVLTQTPITIPQAEQLLMLRQNLPKHHPDIPHFRAFEGGMLSLGGFLTGRPDLVVYWGTSGQRISDRHHFDSFSLWELHRFGRLLHGSDVRHFLPKPTPADLHSDVARHLVTLLQHGRGGRSLYAFGWLLDVARGLYTLRHDAVISKTAAGEWALSEGLCPDPDTLRLALAVRRTPALMQDGAVLAQAEQLTPAIQRFAALLQEELTARGISISA